MARTNGPIQVWTRSDTVPTDSEGGYAGGDSTAAAVGTSLDQSSKALGTVDNLVVTGSTLDYGQEATATISGVVPNKTIHIGIPKGMPEDTATQLALDANAAAASAANAADRAEVAEAAQFMTQDEGVATLINDDVAGPLTNDALKAAYALKPGNGNRAVGKGELVVDVDDHGAAGDGVADDTLAIRAAFDAARAGASKRVRFTPGKVYGVTGSLDPAGLTVEATGATIRTLPGVSAHRILRPLEGFTWTGGTLDPNAANTTTTATAEAWFQDGAWDRIAVTDLTILATHGNAFHISGPAVTDAAAALTGPVSLTRVRTEDAGAWAANIRQCSNLAVTECVGLRGGTAGWVINLCRDVTVTGGTFRDCLGTANAGHGIVLMYCLNARVTGASAYGNAGSGITFGGGSTTNTPSRGGVVAGCTADDNGVSGIYVDPTVAGAAGVPVEWGGAISGNTARGNGQDGIGVTNTDGVSITGNTCTGNAKAGVSCNVVNATIDGNTVRNNLYGVAFFALGAGVRVGVNSLSGNSFSNYQVGASVTTAPRFAQMSTTVPAN